MSKSDDIVPPRLRYEVFKRDGYACRYCGRKVPDIQLTTDHIIPVALGGQHEPSNLVAACAECNRGKSSTAPDGPLIEDVREQAVRWKRAIRLAAAERAVEWEEREFYITVFENAWASWNDDGAPCELPAGWRSSVGSFFDAGLDELVMLDALGFAMQNEAVYTESVFRYFCGMCWNRIQDLQSRALDILERGDA